MTAQEEWVRASEALAMLRESSSEYSAKLRICKRANDGLIRARAEQFHFGKQVAPDSDLPKEFWWAGGHEALEQDWTAGDFSTWVNNGSVHCRAYGVTFARADLTRILPKPTDQRFFKSIALSDDDHRIVDKLTGLVPSAALSYKQAVLDLGDETRISFRGPALELRESLREVLDHLAPDEKVEAVQGYCREKDAKGPTTKQRMRYIMKERGKSTSSDVPEKTVGAFEEAIVDLTRAVQKRSSMAAHVSTDRQTVLQLRRLFVAILHEVVDL